MPQACACVRFKIGRMRRGCCSGAPGSHHHCPAHLMEGSSRHVKYSTSTAVSHTAACRASRHAAAAAAAVALAAASPSPLPPARSSSFSSRRRAARNWSMAACAAAGAHAKQQLLRTTWPSATAGARALDALLGRCAACGLQCAAPRASQLPTHSASPPRARPRCSWTPAAAAPCSSTGGFARPARTSRAPGAAPYRLQVRHTTAEALSCAGQWAPPPLSSELRIRAVCLAQAWERMCEHVHAHNWPQPLTLLLVLAPPARH